MGGLEGEFPRGSGENRRGGHHQRLPRPEQPAGRAAGSFIPRSKDAGMRAERTGGGGGGHTDNVQTGGTRWGGVGSAGMEEKGRGPAGITPPPILIPIPILSQCPVMKPLPSQYSPAVSIPCPHLSPLGARCVLAFVSQSCCLPVPISFCPINPRHESR